MSKNKKENTKENTKEEKRNLSEAGKQTLEGVMSTIQRYNDYRKNAIEKNAPSDKKELGQMYLMYAMSTLSNEAANLKNHLSDASKKIVSRYIDLISDDLEAAISDSQEEKKIGINRSRRAAKAEIMSAPKSQPSLNDNDKASLAKAADEVGNHILGSIQAELSQRPRDVDVKAKSQAYKKKVMDRLSMGRLNQEKDELSKMLKSQKIGAHEANPYRQNMLFSAIERAQNDFGDFLSKESREELMQHIDLLQDQLKASGTTRPGNKSVSSARANVRKALLTPSSPPYYLTPQDQLILKQEAEKAAANIITMIRDNLSSKAIDSNISKRLRDEMLDMGMEFSDENFDKVSNYVSHVTKGLNPDQLAAFEETILDDMKAGIKKNQTFFSKVRHFFGDKKTEISDDKLIHVAADLKRKIHADMEARSEMSRDHDQVNGSLQLDEPAWQVSEKIGKENTKKYSKDLEPQQAIKKPKKQKSHEEAALHDKEAREQSSSQIGK